MAFYCMENKDIFHNCDVIEVGGGKSCLAGMCVAINCKVSSILLSDGNKKCVENVEDIICRNWPPDRSCSNKVSAAVIRWDNKATYAEHSEKFDILLAADCLFFKDVQLELIDAILYMLKPDGKALLFAPHRGDTLSKFIALCQGKFSNISLSETEAYSDIIEHCHKVASLHNKLYNPNLHKPVLLLVQK